MHQIMLFYVSSTGEHYSQFFDVPSPEALPEGESMVDAMELFAASSRDTMARVVQNMFIGVPLGVYIADKKAMM